MGRADDSKIIFKDIEKNNYYFVMDGVKSCSQV